MDLVVMETNSGDISVLIPDMSNPADWGPEGKQILITKDLDDDGRGLFIVDVTAIPRSTGPICRPERPHG